MAFSDRVLPAEIFEQGSSLVDLNDRLYKALSASGGERDNKWKYIRKTLTHPYNGRTARQQLLRGALAPYQQSIPNFLKQWKCGKRTIRCALPSIAHHDWKYSSSLVLALNNPSLQLLEKERLVNLRLLIVDVCKGVNIGKLTPIRLDDTLETLVLRLPSYLLIPALRLLGAPFKSPTILYWQTSITPFDNVEGVVKDLAELLPSLRRLIVCTSAPLKLSPGLPPSLEITQQRDDISALA